MDLKNIYIGEKEKELAEVFKHLVSEIYKSSLPAEMDNSFCDLNFDIKLPRVPKLLIFGEGCLPDKELKEFIQLNFQRTTDYIVILSNHLTSLGPQFDQFINNRIWILSSPLDTKQFTTALDKVFVSDKNKKLNYHRISFNLLPQIGSKCSTDLFIKLSENKYVKILNEDAVIDDVFIGKYQEKAAKNLYITIDSIKPFYEKKLASFKLSNV